MTISSPSNSDPSSNMHLCERIKELGYAPSKTVRLYGQKCEILSDPFMESGNVTIQVRTQQEIRMLRLPSTILQMALKRAA